MHYYSKNIADFNNATRHLTRLERSLYSDAIELYYDTEKPLTSDINKLNRLLLAHSQDEKDALNTVLNEYFVLTDDGYVNKRCDEEIQAFHAKSNKAKESVNKRWNNERNTNVIQPYNEGNTNQEPITNNHKPLTTIKPKPPRTSALDDGFLEFWNIYPKKTGKVDAQKKWISKKPNIDGVLQALQWQIASEQWNKNNGEFIPNPSTYINQERWNDEPPKLRAVF